MQPSTDTEQSLKAFKAHVKELAADPSFVHHNWFVRWHLEIVERLALELCQRYPQLDKQLIVLMVWLHDYGKIVDFDNQYMMTVVAGREKLMELHLPSELVGKAIEYVEILDKKLELDLRQAPVEVQIVSSADGCAHMVGPFYKIFWDNNIDKNFQNLTIDERNRGDLAKLEKDWTRKIVLPEARTAFQKYYDVLCVQAGKFPTNFFG